MLKILSAIIIICNLLYAEESPDTLINNKGKSETGFPPTLKSLDSTAVNDSTILRDSAIVADTLVPLQGKPISDVSQIINKRTFLFFNYRYAGDFLRPFSLNFIKDLAFIGEQNETFLYGVGTGGISFFEDGVLWNSRHANYLNLNFIQSEDIDSVEIVPSPRGFLYGPYNNPVSVNFIMKDFPSKIPYSRIHYYQGTFGEAMFDGKFNALIFRKLNFSFQITNRSADDRYKNSEFGIWLANLKLKYFLSKKVNISLLYNYVDFDGGLNGGVDIESISSISTDINSVLYDETLAPVVYPDRMQSVINHNAGIRIQAVSFDNSISELKFYYKFYKEEINDPGDTLTLHSKNIYKLHGIAFSHDQKFGMIDLKFLSDYERYNGDEDNYLLPDPYTSTSHSEKNVFSAAAVLSADFVSGLLVPSVFYKYQNLRENFTWFIIDTLLVNETNGYSGYGADLRVNVNDLLSFYAGASIFQHRIAEGNRDTKTFELSGNYKSDNLLIDLKFFTRTGSAVIPWYNAKFPPVIYGNLSGLGLLLNYKFREILFETNTSFYSPSGNNEVIGIPEFQSISGIYLNDYFFDNNLWLKAGFIFTYTGNIKAYSKIREKLIDVEPSNKIDFSLAGEIQKVAVIYFIWENLFDSRYYITPYYPMPSRSVRFGVTWELFN